MNNPLLSLEPFKLERFFALYEFSVRYQMGPSDCETMRVKDLLALSGADAEKQFMDLSLGYTESTGGSDLLAAITDLYETIEPGHILTAAPEEAIFLFIMSFLSRGDHVIVMTPAYQSLLSLPIAAGCEVSTLPVEEKGDGWAINLDRLQEQIKKNTACIIINSPHNPTGLVLSPEERKELAEIARQNQIVVFCDEMYWKLEYGTDTSPPSFCEDYENAVCLSGLSKAYGLPGLRIGWLTSRRNDILKAAASLKDYTTICSSAPSEFLAATALCNREAILNKTRFIVKENLKLVDTLFSNHPGILIQKRGTGGSTILPKFTPGISSEDISRRLAREKETLLVPGTLFDMSEEYFRIGLGRRELAVALDRFNDFLEEEFGGP